MPKSPTLRDHPAASPAGKLPAALRPVLETGPVDVYDRARETRMLWRDAQGVERGVGVFSCPDTGGTRFPGHRPCTLEPATGPDADWGLIAALDGKTADGEPLVGGAEVRATVLIVPTHRCALAIEFHRDRAQFCAAYPVCLSRYRAALKAHSDATSVTDWGMAKGLLLYSLGFGTEKLAADSELRAKVARYRATRVHAIGAAQRGIDRLMRHVVEERAASGCRNSCVACVANVVARHEVSALIAAAGVGQFHETNNDVAALALGWWAAFEAYFQGRDRDGPFSRRQSGRMVDPILDYNK